MSISKINYSIIPDSNLALTFSFLNVNSLPIVARVCKQFHEIN